MLKSMLETVELHLKRANDNYDDILNINIDLNMFEDKDKVKTIDAFIFRFIKLQDFMGDKFFKEILKSVYEYKDNMSLLDVLDKLEKLNIIKNSDRWIEYRTVRNKLTHEYPNNEQDICDGIKIALDYFIEIKEMVKEIKAYINNKELK